MEEIYVIFNLVCIVAFFIFVAWSVVKEEWARACFFLILLQTFFNAPWPN